MPLSPDPTRRSAWSARAMVGARCAVCGRWPAQPVCEGCMARFAGAPLPCLLAAGPIDRCVAAVAYGYPWSGLLARFKFHDEPGWAGPLSALLARAGRQSGLLTACEATLPVPLSPRRLAQRGYNQAWELARRLGVPARPQALLRCTEGAPQHTLDRAERLTHLQGAFMAHPAWIDWMQGRHLLLVDDVVTTGATLQAAATALQQAGAGRISALVLAATPAPL